MLFRYALAFLTPGLPFVPAVAITVNIYLIFKLSILTLVRFTIWMTLGLIMYFYYGITNSSLENQSEEIELTVDQAYVKKPSAGGAAGDSESGDYHSTTAVWDRHGYENKMAEESWSQSNFTDGGWSTTKAPVDHTKAWGDPSATSSRPGAAGTAPTTGKVDGGFGIFVEETQYPTWDD